jgi:hypothetical protein
VVAGVAVALVLSVASIVGFAYLPEISYYLYRAAKWVLPWVFLIDVLALPFALSRRLRPLVGAIIFVSSYAFGLLLWTYSVGMAWLLWASPAFSSD